MGGLCRAEAGKREAEGVRRGKLPEKLSCKECEVER
jgi:hypothetical protein